MKKLGFILIMLLSFITLASCGDKEKNPSIEETNKNTNTTLPSADEPLDNDNKLSDGIALEAIKSKLNEFTIIDVRLESEFKEGHIKKATNNPFIKEFQKEIGLNYDTKILLYSNDDTRSAEAQLHLKELGYKKSQYLIGGLNGYIKAGLEIAKPSVKPLSRVGYQQIKHSYLKTECLSLSLQAEAYDSSFNYLPLYKKEILYKLFLNNEVVLAGSIYTNQAGKASLELKLNNLKAASYRLELIINDEAYDNVPVYFNFSITDKLIEEKINSFEDLYNSGYFESFNEYDYNYLKANIFKSLSGFRLLDNDNNEILIDSLLNDKPTIIMMSSLSCAGCEQALEYLTRLNLSAINLYYVVSFIDDDEFDSAKANVSAKLNKIGFPLDNLYFDNVDHLAERVLLFEATPELLFIDNNSEIVNIFRNTKEALESLDGFRSAINKPLMDSFNLELNKKDDKIVVTVENGSSTESHILNKGDKLPEIAPDVKKNYRFVGFSINGEIVDISNISFTKDTLIKAEYKKIYIEADELLGLKHTLIDLRAKEKYNANHLPGAINIEELHLRLELDSYNIDHDAILVLYGVEPKNEILEFLNENDYEAYYLLDYDEPKIIEWTYDERKANGELDWYFDSKELESGNLKRNYGRSYLDLEFMSYNKEIVSLGDMLINSGKPTIIMIGSTTCGACVYPWNEFIKQSEGFEYNFVEAVMLRSSEDYNTVIDNDLSKLSPSEALNYKKYKVLDINNHCRNELIASETPIYYILDKNGNLTNLRNSLFKAMDYIKEIEDTVSILDRTIIDGNTKEIKLDDRINANELSSIKNNDSLYNMVTTNYSKFVLKERYYDYAHAVRGIGGFFNINNYDFNNETVLYILNSNNSDFKSSISFLDNLNMEALPYNFLIIVDDNSKYHNELINKPYRDKIMLDDNNINVINDFILLDCSYFVLLDSFGNITNASLDFNRIAGLVDKIRNTKSVKSPNILTNRSVAKPNDIVVRKNEIVDLGFISHIDSQRDMARLDYLNLNFGRNYLDVEVIDNNLNTVSIRSLVDNKRPTILCFLQSYQDDYYYNFNPLYELKDRANIIIIFTNESNEPYDMEFVDRMLRDGKSELIKRANSGENREKFRDVVKQMYPTLDGDALEKKVDEYLDEVYDFEKMKPFIYGSTTAYTTPLLDTIVRGVQLYLDRNGNLANVSQSYYNVGGTFRGVLDKIKDYICVEG